MRSVRNAYYFPGYLAHPRAGGKSAATERRSGASLKDVPANPSEPHHMFGAMVMLLGLQLMGPALLITTGYFNRVLAMFPATLPHVLAAMAFVGGLTIIGGFVLFLDGLRRNTAA